MNDDMPPFDSGAYTGPLECSTCGGSGEVWGSVYDVEPDTCPDCLEPATDIPPVCMDPRHQLGEEVCPGCKTPA